MYAVEAHGITKAFGKITALRNVGFSLREGGILTLLGPNGAGKSTLLKIVAGLYRQDSGSVRIFGELPDSNGDVRERISFLGENYALYDDLSVRDNLMFFASMYGIGTHTAENRIKNLLSEFRAAEYMERKVGELSRGTKQKVAICRALINNPSLLLLDEPTAFLDVSSSELLHSILERLAGSRASIIYATQRLEELYRLGGNVLMLSKGREVVNGDIRRVLKKLGHVRIELTLYNEMSGAMIKTVGKKWKIEEHGRRVIANVGSIDMIPVLIKDFVSHGGKIMSVTYLNRSIEELMTHG